MANDYETIDYITIPFDFIFFLLLSREKTKDNFQM